MSRRPLGSIGHLACFSFHETKNIISGEGGMLVINDERFIRRAEIIWEKGTNRAEFFRGEVNKYGWVDTGSSFLPSEIVAAFLWAQLENLDEIQDRRKAIWNRYCEALSSHPNFQTSTPPNFQTSTPPNFQTSTPPSLQTSKPPNFSLPIIPSYATNNAHMFYLLFPDLSKRTDFIAKMKARDVGCVFHYLPLHSSEYFLKHGGALGDRALPAGGESGALGDRALPNCDRFADCLVRLPLYYELAGEQQEKVLSAIRESL